MMSSYVCMVFRAMRIVAIACALSLSAVVSSAVAEGLEYHSNIGVFVGGSTEYGDERETSGLLGVEYEYRINSLWGVAGVAELSVSDFKRSHLLGAGGTLRLMRY